VASNILFNQLFEPESSTYTYLIADPSTREAALIDPVLETVDRDLKLIDELGLRLVYVLDTHVHADHITGAGEMRKRLGIKTGISLNAGVNCADIPLVDGQELSLGKVKIKVYETPGHTNTCLTFHCGNFLFTGDALLIRSCGRTDFQQGSADKLFDSVRSVLFQFPDETLVYPGHDYRGFTSTWIGVEKKHNSRLKESISREEFKKIMSDLKLPNPKKIQEAVPANLACGLAQEKRVIRPRIVDGVPEVSVTEVFGHADSIRSNQVRVIDVRRPDEFDGEFGHIEGAELVTLGPALIQFLEEGDRNQEIIFVCRSGGRSSQATSESIRLGYQFTANMVGGMIQWTEKKFPAKRI
jgi:glyoxylase-like metal-dependent hydrolase (beta-lactamase superfamily II)/rhodanese-related sulfurtransferase